MWKYNESGQLEELMHEDAAGVLDKFHYTYDAMGNKTAIQKQRRGLPEESGCYQYSYDKLQRLIGVEKDGKHIRSYQYDTFSNRIEMEDNTKGIKNIYQYNALNQLIEQEIWETPDITTKINTFINENDIDNIKHNNNANILHKTFTYDKRGNLTGEYQEDALLHGYCFNHMNRLEKAWNYQGEEAQYFYNALGQRTGRTANGEKEDYLLDLTKPYHNLLELQKGKQTQTFFWDFNAAVMEDEKRNLRYYLQDDLGSPLRVLYRNGYGEAYGYDEFGTELYESDPIKEEKTKKKYGKQGENQPFGYTGYRYDNISGSYFAQAREYLPEIGRFMEEDLILQGNNWYLYCNANPLRYIDPFGLDAILVNKKVDNILGDVGIEHMGAFFQDENDDWYFFFWGNDVKYEKIEDPNIFDSMESINEYLYAHDLYKKENKPYIDSVYIRGDFTQSHIDAMNLLKEYTDALNLHKQLTGEDTLWNPEYGFLSNNCTQVTMELFSKGILPSGLSVGAYLSLHYSITMVPNWNMNNMQDIFFNSAFNKEDYNAALQKIYDSTILWNTYWYAKEMADFLTGCTEI